MVAEMCSLEVGCSVIKELTDGERGEVIVRAPDDGSSKNALLSEQSTLYIEPKWTLMMDSLRSEFPPVERMVSSTVERFGDAFNH